jgi:hypothetical protein
MELLNFAQSQLTGEYYAALERAREIQNIDARELKIATISYPSKESIMKLAEELKSFVDNK